MNYKAKQKTCVDLACKETPLHHSNVYRSKAKKKKSHGKLNNINNQSFLYRHPLFSPSFFFLKSPLFKDFVRCKYGQEI